ncbi:hypothetical protein ACLIYP_05055 [Streptomyces nanhaiensis]|uniref:hypothetical protein n=1 Tax=Streptomyces nanhaiensis TaxID=679319 RepID=UPI00399CB509
MVSADVVAARVRDELAAAGLPLAPQFTTVDERFRTGVCVVVEDEGDGVERVFVSWRTHHTLVGASSRALLRGDAAHPAVMHHGRVCRAVRDAMSEILSSAGFVVEHADEYNEYRPLELRVSAGPEPYSPAWGDAGDGTGG